jgi:hypothetical protein
VCCRFPAAADGAGVCGVVRKISTGPMVGHDGDDSENVDVQAWRRIKRPMKSRIGFSS